MAKMTIKVDRLSVPTNLTRRTTYLTEVPAGSDKFLLGPKHKSYKHQYANIYFVRLRLLRRILEERAASRWSGLDGGPQLVSRVLDVTRGRFCYVVGTVYLDMAMKPNILEDIARDQSIPAPPPLKKFCSPEDTVYLEDESGRLRLTGSIFKDVTLVSGVILGVVGTENDSGEFEVQDLCLCGAAPQPSKDVTSEMDVDGAVPQGEWIAVVSGLDIGANKVDDCKQYIRLQLLVEYLTGQLGDQLDQSKVAEVTRLLILGDTFAPYDPSRGAADDLATTRGPSALSSKAPKKVATTQPHPLTIMSAYIREIAECMPIHMMPGEKDPSSLALPQQPFPRAMFREIKQFESFRCETNPLWLGIGESLVLATSGQPVNDMFKYVPDPVEESDTVEHNESLRMRLLRLTLESRHITPTAPDTLHCYPYFGTDPFILNHTPHIYIHGNQPRFETKVIEDDETKCRTICVPRFADRGELVLVNVRTLEVRLVSFDTDRGLQKAEPALEPMDTDA